MIRFTFLLISLIFFPPTVFSQKIIAFDKSGKVKRIRYYEGEYISLKKLDKIKVAGIIDQIDQKSFVVDGIKITLDSVRAVYNTQSGMGYRLISRIFVIPAIGYMPLITVNGLINNDKPIIRQNQFYYGGGFITIALLSNFLASRPFKISNKRPLKIIDVSI